MQTKYIAALTFGLCAFGATAEAQLKCRTVTLPSQHGTGQVTPIVIPPRTISPGLYPVAYFHPGNGATVGLEFWAHRIRTAGVPDPPRDLAYVNGYIANAADNSDIKLVMPAQSRGPAGDGVWQVFPMSTFLHAGEYFAVGLYNAWDQPVTVDLIITLRECVP